MWLGIETKLHQIQLFNCFFLQRPKIAFFGQNLWTQTLDETELILELVKDICNELDVRSLCHKILQNVGILTDADRWVRLIKEVTEGGIQTLNVHESFGNSSMIMLVKLRKVKTQDESFPHFRCSLFLVGGDPGNQYLESNLFDVCSHSTVEEVTTKLHKHDEVFSAPSLLQESLKDQREWSNWLLFYTTLGWRNRHTN